MRRSRSSQETRQALLEQGVTTLGRGGYHGTGIQEVLDAVGVPKGSFYNYFESKEHFGSEVIRRFAEGVFARMDKWLADPEGDALSALHAFHEDEIHRHDKERIGCLFGNLGAELGGTSKRLQHALSEGLRGMEERFTQIIRLAQEQGTVRTDLSAEKLGAFLLNYYEGALLRMKIEGTVEPIRRVRTLILDDFFRPREGNLASPRGRGGP